MKQSTMDFAKNDLTKTIRLTNDEDYINKVWNLTNDYYDGRPGDDPRNQNQNLGFEFWDSRESEVNMYNIKSKLLQNIELMPEEYATDLQYLHTLYSMTKFHLMEVATDLERAKA